jgi:hypothetical protein
VLRLERAAAEEAARLAKADADRKAAAAAVAAAAAAKAQAEADEAARSQAAAEVCVCVCGGPALSIHSCRQLTRCLLLQTRDLAEVTGASLRVRGSRFKYNNINFSRYRTSLSYGCLLACVHACHAGCAGRREASSAECRTNRGSARYTTSASSRRCSISSSNSRRRRC